MRILYVATMATPLENILRGKERIEGLPGFYFPMRMLLEQGHHLDFVLLSNFAGPFDIKIDWFQEELILANISMPHSPKGGLYRILRGLLRTFLLMKEAWRATGRHQYDLIYGHGPTSLIAQMVGVVRRIPVGVRMYGAGIFTFSDIKKYGRVGAAIRHPVEAAIMRMPYAFMLMTDDNTAGQEVHRAWTPRRHPGEFLHWRTGIDMAPVESCRSTEAPPKEDYLFFAGRFDRTKRQDRVLRIAKGIHGRGWPVHVYFAGPLEPGPSDPSYLTELHEVVVELGLSGYVHFLGGVPQETLRVFAKQAVATVFMQEVSNMGNVFYEAMAAGSVVVASDDGYVGRFIEQGVNGFVVDGLEGAVSAIQGLLEEPERRESIGARAREAALKHFTSSEERFGREVSLIERFVRSEADR